MSQERLERALAGQSEAGVQVLRGERPPWLDGPTARALLTPFMAAFMVAAAMLRARMGDVALDLLGLGLRTLAAAFVLRAVIDLARTARRLWGQRDAARHSLAWDEEGLLWRSPAGSHYVPRGAVAAVVAPPERVPGLSGQRAREVWLALWPDEGTTQLTLPPYFASDSELLVTRLRRWLGEVSPPEPYDEGDDPAETLARVRGGVPRGASVVRSYRRLWERAPTVWLLLSFAALDALRVAPRAWLDTLLTPLLAMAAAGALAPLLWWLWVRRRSSATGGILLVLTPEHAIAPVAAGSVSLAWEDLAEAEVHYRGSWSPLHGAYAVRVLELSGHDGTQLRFDGSLVDTPVEVVAALARALAELQDADGH